MPEFEGNGISQEELFGTGNTEKTGDTNTAKVIEQETTEDLAEQVEHMFANTATLAKSFDARGNSEVN